jgi:hypothetical protein
MAAAVFYNIVQLMLKLASWENKYLTRLKLKLCLKFFSTDTSEAYINQLDSDQGFLPFGSW